MKCLRRNLVFIVASVITGSVYLVHTPPGQKIHVMRRQKISTCYVSLKDTRNLTSKEIQTIYFVTPTYPRREQAPELIRLGQTLMHVPNLHWIVADDAQTCNAMILKLLHRFEIPFTFLTSPMPEFYRHQMWLPRGVANRRAALHWIRRNTNSGVLYFGDDDNTFDLKLFDEIRYTKKVSMFPVGLVGTYGISAPITKQGKVVGFFDPWPSNRKFAVDMAGFAVNVKLLFQNPKATMPFLAGQEENLFLKSLNITLEDIEPRGNACTQVLVWHTQTKKEKLCSIQVQSPSDNTNLPELLKETRYMGISNITESVPVTRA